MSVYNEKPSVREQQIQTCSDRIDKEWPHAAERFRYLMTESHELFSQAARMRKEAFEIYRTNVPPEMRGGQRKPGYRPRKCKVQLDGDSVC